MLTLEGIFARTIAAWGIDQREVAVLLDKASTEFPDLRARADYIKDQLAAMIPGADTLRNAIAGFAVDWVAKSAGKDPDAWGGA